MIKITAHSMLKHQYIDYFIFENEEEFKLTDFNEIHIGRIQDAQVGDYVKSSNGYYMPVLRTVRFRKKTIRPVYFLKVSFPLNHHIATDYYQDTDNCKVKYINFDRCKEQTKNYTSARIKMMMIYLKQGLDIWDSYILAYAIKKPRTTEEYIILENKLRLILESETFVKLLNEYNVMNTLKQTMLNNGFDYQYLTEFMKKVLDNDNEKSDLKKLVFTNAITILSEKYSNNDNNYQPKLDNAYSILQEKNINDTDNADLKQRLLNKQDQD